MDSELTLPTQQIAYQSIEFRRPDESTLEGHANALNLPPTRKSTDTISIADGESQDP